MTVHLTETGMQLLCSKCGLLHHSAMLGDDKAMTISSILHLRNSWRPITLQCTCGARCTILNERICEEAKR